MSPLCPPRLLPAIRVLAVSLIFLLSGCRRGGPQVQGYVEGEFVYVAPALSGELKELLVDRGAQVTPGQLLFKLDDAREQASREEASRRLAEARATFEDARKGQRPTEIQGIEAKLKQAHAALALSEREFARQERLMPNGTSQSEFDRARSARESDTQKVAEAEADLKTAQLGKREDQITAAEANVYAREASLAQADWDVAQKKRAAAQAALVFDTLFRPGEWVAAGRPVVSLLPPENIKVRAFVPEPMLGAVHVGDRASVYADGAPAPFEGKVTFVSPRAEYTPPVIYSNESRAKLVFLIEVNFERGSAAQLHPGQPVDVIIGD